jgi:acetyl-CoA acetyltransferase
VGIHGNEVADLLAKKGTTLYKSNQMLEAHEAKTIVKNKIKKNAKLKMTTKINGGPISI